MPRNEIILKKKMKRLLKKNVKVKKKEVWEIKKN